MRARNSTRSFAPESGKEDVLDKTHVVLTGDKELKVKIPHRMLLQLHSMKIVQGKRIQDTVAEALDEYFARIRREMADEADQTRAE